MDMKNKPGLERSLSWPQAEKEKLRAFRLLYENHGSDTSKMHIMPGEIKIVEYLQNMDKRLAQILNEVKEVRKICSQSYKTSGTGRKHITLMKRGKKNVSRRTSTNRVLCHHPYEKSQAEKRRTL